MVICRIQLICCCPDVVVCNGVGINTSGETIKRSTVSVATNVALQLMLVLFCRVRKNSGVCGVMV